MNINFSLEKMLPFLVDVFKKGGNIRFAAQGTSMLPTIRPNRDSILLVYPNELKIGDIVLYKRKDGTFVLHRIIDISNDSFTMRGDNQIVDEFGIVREQIIAKASGIYRGEKYFDSSSKKYYLSFCGKFKNSIRKLKQRIKGVFHK